MGQQQILLVILAVIIIGAAVSVGIAHFGAQSVGANKDGVTTSLTMIGADAYHYRLRPNRPCNLPPDQSPAGTGTAVALRTPITPPSTCASHPWKVSR